MYLFYYDVLEIYFFGGRIMSTALSIKRCSTQNALYYLYKKQQKTLNEEKRNKYILSVTIISLNPNPLKCLI